jgi:hypothetical protein
MHISNDTIAPDLEQAYFEFLLDYYLPEYDANKGLRQHQQMDT